MADPQAPRPFTGTVGDYLEPDAEPEARSAGFGTPLETVKLIAFVDSSALIALADAGDASHSAAVDAYRDLVSSGYRLFTTEFMIAEAFDLLRFGPGPEIARQWLQVCKIARCPVEERDITRARQRILAETDATSAISMADAISLAVMDRLGVTDVFAVDQTVLDAIS